MIIIPVFDETKATVHSINKHSCVLYLEEATEKDRISYCEYFEQHQGIRKEYDKRGGHSYAAYIVENQSVFINYYDSAHILTVVTEECNDYFTYQDFSYQDIRIVPQLTQLSLEDFGMSYAIRLSDGRFIVIDGGWNFEPDVDRLMQCLKEGSPHEKPIIAAWFLTHPHVDHFHCFIGFAEKYGKDVIVEKCFANFPEADDLERFREFSKDDFRVKNTASQYTIPLMYEKIKQLQAKFYTPHTGQIYKIGDAVCEILSSIDDTIHCSESVNASSLVFKMELAGQTLLWTADTSFEIAKLPQRYGAYLKADILQVPHHGFQCGDYRAEIEGYQLIQPMVCLLPASALNAYTGFCSLFPSTNYLMTHAEIGELIAGTPQRTISLPYTPPCVAKEKLKNNYLSGMDNNGSRTWIFTDLNSSCADDFEFSMLNTCVMPAVIFASLIFENPKDNIRHIKVTLQPYSYRKVCITDECEVELNGVYFNWEALDVKGLPCNQSFAIRFMSDMPIVISHKNHFPAHVTINRF